MLRGPVTKSAASARTRRISRHYVLERLEGRVVPSYTFTYNAGTHIATALSTGGNNDALVIDQTAGNLQYNLNATGASTNWGGQTVPNSAATTVNIIEASGGTGESVTIGSTAAPLSMLAAHFAILNTQVPLSSSLTLNDTNGAIQAVGSNAYSVNNGTFVGPGSSAPFTLTSNVNQTSGVVIEGSPQSDTLSVLGTTAGVPVFFVGGVGTNAVNLGNNPGTPASSTLSTIHSTVNVTDPLGTATMIVDDAGTTASASGSIDFLSAPSYEVTGLGFGTGGKTVFNGGSPGVNNLVVNPGRSGATGVIMNVINTPAGMTTTINGGANQNTFNLSTAAAANGLGNLLGRVVVNNGSSGLGSITLDDQSRSGNDSYTLTGTTVSSTGGFGGLNYSGFGLGALTLNAENTLASGGNSTININGTANGTATTVNGDSGVDTININGTSPSGTLSVTTGSTGTSTVNVVADTAPLTIAAHGATAGPDTVNLGAADGTGTLANITGPVTVFGLSLYELNINDQGDALPRTYALTINNGADTGSLALSPAGPFLSFRPGDLSTLTANGSGLSNTFNVNTTPTNVTTNINAGSGIDSVNVFGTGLGSTLNIDGQGGANGVVLGGNTTAPLGLENFLGAAVNVVDTGGTVALTLDDSRDTTGQTATLTSTRVIGLAPASINYTTPASAGGTGVSALTANGGSGGNIFTINGTLANSVAPGETLNSGAGSDTINVLATTASAPLVIHGHNGNDRVNLTNAGSVTGIAGAVTIDNVAGLTAILADASADDSDHADMLMQGAAMSTLTGLAAAPITYTVTNISTLTIDTNALGNQMLTDDFSQGNPIPSGAVPGLVFNAGSTAATAANSHVLNLVGTLPGGALVSETHNAEDPVVGGPRAMATSGSSPRRTSTWA